MAVRISPPAPSWGRGIYPCRAPRLRRRNNSGLCRCVERVASSRNRCDARLPLIPAAQRKTERDTRCPWCRRNNGHVPPRTAPVAESFADLGDAERQLKARAVEDVMKINENTLSSFGAEVGDPGSIFQSSDIRLEHKIELTRICQSAGL